MPPGGQCAALFRGWHADCLRRRGKLFRLCAGPYFINGDAMNRFTLKQLKYFVTVVETESIA
ncbi:MAG: LysR family transcriptional regulator, partial [Klebsiella pneumoniae]|nr:LysR family transcriptional regulator [Klebsiella pneumoniae]MDU7336452.1 LysR family transcriptional regulator [Klebsiella pneumoniae]